MENATESSNGGSKAEGTSLGSILITLQSLILFFASAGNLVVLMILYLHRKRRRLARVNLFILHLCVADLAVAMFNVAPNLCEIVSFPEPCFLKTSSSACKIMQYLTVVSVYGSTYILVVTAVDRFLAIRFPLWAQRLTDRHAHIMAAVAWSLAFTFSVPQIIIFKYDTNSSLCEPSWSSDLSQHIRRENIYIAWFASAVWILPTIIMAICYVTITCVVVCRGQSLLKDGGKTMSIHQKSNRSIMRKRLLKPVRLTLAVVVGYILCWSPWMLATMLFQYGGIRENNTSYLIMELFTYLIGFNSCINPWIYLCFNYRGVRRKPREKMTYVSTNTNTIMDTTAPIDGSRTQTTRWRGESTDINESTSMF